VAPYRILKLHGLKILKWLSIRQISAFMVADQPAMRSATSFVENTRWSGICIIL
jgi:hypothetical protein